MPYTLTITNVTQAQAVQLVEEIGGGSVAYSDDQGKGAAAHWPAKKLIAYPAGDSVATIEKT